MYSSECNFYAHTQKKQNNKKITISIEKESVSHTHKFTYI